MQYWSSWETTKIEHTHSEPTWTRTINKGDTLNHVWLSLHLLNSSVQLMERHALARGFFYCDVCNMVLIHIINKSAKPKLYYSSCLLHAQHEQSLTQERIELAPGTQPCSQHWHTPSLNSAIPFPTLQRQYQRHGHNWNAIVYVSKASEYLYIKLQLCWQATC